VLQALPPLAGFDEARLFNVMEVALSKKLPAEAILTICDAWLGWLERALQEYLPSEFALGVTEIVLSVTVGKPELRRTFSQIILKQTDTGALIAFLRDYISHWNELDVDERATILRLLSDDRPDVLWLRATALACRNVPREIEEAILGKGGLLSFSPGDLIDQIPFNLLEACVKTYRGNPGILSYIGPHHASAVWKEVVWELARHPEHPLWGSAVEEILSVGSSNTDRSAKIFSAMPKAANRLFKLLLSHNVRTNAGWNSAAWHAVLTNAPDKATLDSWFDEMAAAAPAILDGLYDIRLWMKDQPWVDHLLNRLGADVALNDLAYVLEKDLGQDTGIRSKAVQLIDACYHDRPAKLLHTHDRVAKVLRDVGLESDALVKLVLVARERSLEEMTQIRKMFEPVSEQLKGWQSKFVTG
jgi:hypothetical protein